MQGSVCDARPREISNNNKTRQGNEIPHALPTDRIHPHRVNRMSDASPAYVSVKLHLRESNSGHVEKAFKSNVDSQIQAS